MSKPSADFLQIMKERGFVHQCTDEAGLAEKIKSGPITAYIGFDATADSLHVGSLVPIMILHWLQKTGNKPIVLMGGGTTKVGDPSGKDSARQMLDDAAINENIKGIQRAFAPFLKFGTGATDATMVNNDDWLKDIQYIAFLRDYGRHFSVNRMLSFDSVKLRLEREQNLSFLEFNYMILQAYDFVELNRRYGCVLQMGGSDQWGNIVNGVELGRRVADMSLFGLTAPLLTTASGAKMGKTADGAIWVNEDRLSHYDYYQFWRNTEDADVGRFLRLFTVLPLDEIQKLEALQGAEINEAKKILALEATALCRGRENALQAAETARQTFEQGLTSEGLPTVEIARSQLENGIAIFTLLRESGLVESNGEARRLIQGRGARINDQVIEDEGFTATLHHVNDDGVIKLSAGKKKHALIKAV